MEMLEDRRVLAVTVGFEGPFELQNWTDTGIAGGTTTITPTTGPSATAEFAYNVNLGGGGVTQRTTDFTLVGGAPENGVFRFDYDYSGYHAFFSADADFLTLNGAQATAVVNSTTSGSFNFTGSESLGVTQGDTLGFRVGGNNADSDSRLIGTLEVSSFSFVGASDLIVDSLADTPDDGDYSAGNFTLREAIELANAIPGADTITFDPAVFGTEQTISIGSQLPAITEGLTIEGPGADLLTIDAGLGGDGTVNGNGYRHFEVDDLSGSTTIDVNLRGVTLTGGDVTTGGGGAIRSLENLTVERSVITGNHTSGVNFGGGIFADGIGTLTVRDSTLSGNTSYSGGALINYTDGAGSVVIENSTLSGNSENGYTGGAIFNQGTLTITSSTITDNVGDVGGIFTRFNNEVNLSNTIIAGNRNGGGSPTNLGGAAPGVNLFNLIGPGAGASFGMVNGVNGNQLGVTDAGLGTLQDNGGPTPTHALLDSSPAIDAGDPAFASPPDFDQRGPGFDRVVGSVVDIGAFEVQDDHANDSAGATPIADADRLSGNIQYNGDADYFSFAAVAGEFYRLVADHDGIGSTEITLYDTDGVTPILINDSERLSDNGEDLGDAWVLWQAPADGTYFAAVREIGDDATGSYDLELDTFPVTDVAVPSATSGAIDNNRDTAIYRFSATAGVPVPLLAVDAGIGDPALLVYDTDGATVLASDTVVGDASLTFVPPASGDYFAEVRDRRDDGTGEFLLFVGTPSDDHGDDAGAATPVAIGSATPGQIFPIGDPDYFSFAATAGQFYRLATDDRQISATEITLYDTDGVTPLLVDDSVGIGDAWIAWIAPADGIYYAAVRELGNNSIGSYDFLVDAVTTTSVAAPSTTPGQIDTTLQSKAFRLVGYAGVPYIIDTDGPGRTIDTTLALYDAQSNQLGFDDDGGSGSSSRIEFTPTVDGVYFLEVREYNDDQTGAFPFNVTIAADLQVTNTNDAGPGSLRQAILDANAGLGSSIAFSGAVFLDNTPDVITLTTGEMAITQSVTIYGPGADRLTIDAGLGGDGLVNGNGFRHFLVDDLNSATTIDVSISGVTLTGGDVATGGGGAIRSLENLTVERSVITGNHTSGSNFGGGIFAGGIGTLTVRDSTLSGNTSYSGGALINYTNGAGSVVIENSTLSGNSATEFAGGAIFNQGDLTLRNTTITGNQDLTETTGSLFEGSGGVYSRYSTASIVVQNTIIVGNTRSTGAGPVADDFRNSDPSGPPASAVDATFSLFGAVAGPGITDGVDGNQIGVADAGLGALQDNGGPTPTHALEFGSPALNAGDPVFSAPPSFDQRGPGFDRVALGRIDIGAYEAQTAPVAPLNPGDFNGDGFVDNSDLNLLLANWGATTVPPTWINGFDTFVDNGELNALLANWGFGIGSSAAFATTSSPAEPLAIESAAGFETGVKPLVSAVAADSVEADAAFASLGAETSTMPAAPSRSVSNAVAESSPAMSLLLLPSMQVIEQEEAELAALDLAHAEGDQPATTVRPALRQARLGSGIGVGVSQR
ncbi:hypothetical protein Pla111_34340 [Botrimarina hoheduenensis]|uniref:Probable pectate lyase C n=2 Tax=Botrimarina hoheduenensis TaxID=2528000 RepID=A0A5C5VPX2_9BACT|nr:hypothetical protein Pla111_34340 [Botrimarina hoheduenensis]